MNNEQFIIIKGQQLIMEMLLSTMPDLLKEVWMTTYNEHNQQVVNLLEKQGYNCKPAENE